MKIPVRPVRFALLVFLVGLFPALTVGGQPAEKAPTQETAPTPEKPPWEWTLEERIAVRFDLEAVKERTKEYNARFLAERGVVIPPNQESLSGREHPELFFPTDLFRMFLDRAFGPDRESWARHRQVFAERTSHLDLNADFWRDVSIVASEVLSRRHQIHQLFAEHDSLRGEAKERETEAVSAELKRLNKGMCLAQKKALDQLREIYGKEAFDRFLYEAVAPDQWQTGAYDEHSAESARRRERGCVDVP